MFSQVISQNQMNALASHFGDTLLRNEVMARYSVLGVGGPADFLVQVKKGADLEDTIRFLWEEKIPFFVYGEGVEYLHHVALDDNILWDTEEPGAAQAAISLAEEHGQGRRSVAEDPKFRNAETGDFRLTNDSPAFKVGFRPFDTWGPRESPGPKR